MKNDKQWYVLSYPMGSEESVLEYCINKLEQLPQESIAVLPEYIAYTVENGNKALEQLKVTAISKKISIMTTINMIPIDLPYMENNRNYNTLIIITKEGKIHTPQAKITPQSFERVQYDEKFPKMNVADYHYLNKVELHINNEVKTAIFIICSDVYTLMAGVEKVKDLHADFCIVPGNFGIGAEAAVRRVLTRFRDAGIFKTTIFSNPFQQLKKSSHKPLVQEACDFITSSNQNSLQLSDWERIELLKRNVCIYPDQQVPSFIHMASLTKMGQGRMTVSMSRLDVDVHINQYEKKVIL
ncbi:hypothetical protein [Bacillus solimangrovi]|uniref:CN hydrolase domain-containing protein n=1 Tax=Bacillus solimangrovi TaxID=1305675 RepID=A0A1E5LCF4_9BACI|nr:hypothetical protein [Bacillus solimangrovi]OEH91775.1 hypothetical protein BFG57_03275 [Bacillus solimangrovi]